MGELAEPAVEVSLELPALVVDDVFWESPELRAVVARDPRGGIVLVGRQHFQSLMAGRRGYGRALHHRRVLADLRLPAPLVLGADTGIVAASEAILGRERARRYDDSVVAFDDGALGLVSTSKVMGCLAELNAYQAIHDPLTGLGNRARLRAFLADRDPNQPDAVLFLDLDRFKVINDSLGHACGDQLLRELAARIAACLRAGDLVCRIGGDEFVIVLRGVARVEVAEEVATRVLAAVAEPVMVSGTAVRLSTSIGIVLGPHAEHEADDLIRRADLAMYDAKAHGRARYAVFDRKLAEHAARRYALESRLRQAVELNEFRLDYQPIVDLRSGHTTRFEALVRWDHPQRGLILPSDFIPMAEETRLIIPIGRWVIEHALQDLTAAFSTHDRDAPGLAVNVSTYQLLEDDFFDHLRDTLAGTGVSPTRLCLEITETVAPDDTDSVLRKLEALRALGVAVALDDFGTGSSSLSLLRRFPINEIKIDRSFIATMLDTPQDATLVRLITQVAHGLNMTVTAEGVEHHHQANTLIAMHCDHAQGYHFGRPGPLSTTPTQTSLVNCTSMVAS